MSSQAIQYPRIVAPVAAPALTPEEAAKGHRAVTMEFPVAVTLTLDWHRKIAYPKGNNQVPEQLADHWWLKAHNVRIVGQSFAVSAIVKPTAGEIQAIKSGKPAKSAKK